MLRRLHPRGKSFGRRWTSPSSFTRCAPIDMQLWDSPCAAASSTPAADCGGGAAISARHLRATPSQRGIGAAACCTSDKNHQLITMLLALETDSLYGYGLFSSSGRPRVILTPCSGVLHRQSVNRPFDATPFQPLNLKMVHYAERVEMDNFVCLDKALTPWDVLRRAAGGRIGQLRTCV